MIRSQLLENLMATEPTEILLVLGHGPQTMTRGGWEAFRETPLLPSEFAGVLRALPAFDEKAGQGFFSPKENLVYHFHVIQADLISKVHFQKRAMQSIENFHLPNLYMETLNLASGFVLMVCPKKHIRQELFVQTAVRLGKETKMHGLFASQSIYPLSQEGSGVFSQVDPDLMIDSQKFDQVLAGVQIVFFDELRHQEDLISILNAIDERRLVIAGVSAATAVEGLAKVLQLISGNSFLLYRWVKSLKLILSQIPLRCQNPGGLYGSEVISVTQEVEGHLQDGNLKAVEKLLCASETGTGIQNLNQSLLHHLLKRKIDMRTAFSLSNTPDELDLLLKKVGV